MQTITTHEQLFVDGKITERTATHIVTGAHGYETLCTSGYNIRYNEKQELVESCEKIAEGELPVTCPTCYALPASQSGKTYISSRQATLTLNRGKEILLIQISQKS